MRTPAVLGLLGLLVSGCATYAPAPGAGGTRSASGADRSGTDAAAQSAPAAGTIAEGKRDTAGVARASLRLLDESQAARDAGDFARAATVVERALAIDPNEAILWIELAEIRLAQGDVDAARTLARKALTLAGADRSISARAERLADR